MDTLVPSSHMSDDTSRSQDPSADLLRRWQEHDDVEALDELLRIEVAILKSRIRKRGAQVVQPTASVSDVAQDTVLRVLAVSPAPHFDNPRAMREYLWTAAQNLLLDHLRRRRNSTVQLDPTQTGQLDQALQTTGGLHGVEARDRAAALGIVLHLLEPDEQQILDLCYTRDLGIAGAAAELGISHEAAKMRLVRARKSLLKKLAKWTEVIG